jgi:hypothetical protein
MFSSFAFVLAKTLINQDHSARRYHLSTHTEHVEPPRRKRGSSNMITQVETGAPLEKDRSAGPENDAILKGTTTWSLAVLSRSSAIKLTSIIGIRSGPGAKTSCNV